ncbi:hypothetical protein CP10139811_0734 [Chlamydia ibidis]|uniref:Uncharacterized protein n=1 Tax=Chlamydia ibidis TaxID=1405396 RepID=S7J338_9CHLA|nr:hypothetical protein CP10139811_0734 [Chlamydia ibidis]
MIFDELISKQEFTPIEKILCFEDDQEFQAYKSTKLQSPLAARNLKISRQLAAYILTDKGEIDNVRVVEAIEALSQKLYPLGPHRHSEAKQREHILNALKVVKEDTTIRDRIKKMFLPSHKSVQDLIRHTLALPESATLTTVHVRQAAIAALFSYLRQDVGSCFASSLAILIHEEYPSKFIADIDDLLSSGKLTRVIGTKEISVPINLSGCIGELFKSLRIIDLYPDPIKKLSLSPGLQKAFIEAQIIDTLDNPQVCLQQLLSHEYLLQKLRFLDDTITTNDILKSTLLHYYNITENTVKGLLLQEGFHNKEQVFFTTQYSNKLSDTQRAFSYLTAYENAKMAFINDTQNRLLKSWEYTLATLADATDSPTFAHISIALGWNSKERDSLFLTITTFIDEETSIAKELVDKCEQTYQEAQSQLQYIENRMRNPFNEQDSKILSMDYMRFRQELNQALQDWNSAQNKIKKLLALPEYLLKFYQKQLPIYFRSSYDAFIQEFSHIIGDAPAGFRILFTHGRSHPNAWTPIYSINEFIHALSDFFSSTETDLLGKQGVVGLEKETSALIHRIISMLHKETFQEAAITRVLQAYGMPVPNNVLSNLSKIIHTPWVYVSGGTVDSLLIDYFENTDSVTTLNKHPENPHELAAFFSDALKDLPIGIKNYIESGSHKLIASSPTHVFSVVAGCPMFRDSWDNDWYSYTWLRDVWVKEQQTFLDSTILSQQGIYNFIERFCKKYHLQKINHDFHDFFSDLSLSIPEMYDKATRFLKEIFSKPEDAYSLYLKRFSQNLVHDLPYVSDQQLPEIIDNVAAYLGIPSRLTYDKFSDIIERFIPKMSLLSSADLRHVFKGMLMSSYQTVYFQEDMFLRLVTAMRHHKLCYPAPLLFGDTNWAYYYFGFILHPGTREIDLWRFNYAGLHGEPLDNRKDLFSVDKTWTLYSNPIDYGMPPPPGYRSHMPKGFF